MHTANNRVVTGFHRNVAQYEYSWTACSVAHIFASRLFRSIQVRSDDRFRAARWTAPTCRTQLTVKLWRCLAVCPVLSVDSKFTVNRSIATSPSYQLHAPATVSAAAHYSVQRRLQVQQKPNQLLALSLKACFTPNSSECKEEETGVRVRHSTANAALWPVASYSRIIITKQLT